MATHRCFNHLRCLLHSRLKEALHSHCISSKSNHALLHSCSTSRVHIHSPSRPQSQPHAQSIALRKHKVSIDVIRGAMAKHGDDLQCTICNVSFPSKHQSAQHSVSKKHVRKFLHRHSDDCDARQCIYCHECYTDDQHKEAHLQSSQHQSTINQLITSLLNNNNSNNNNTSTAAVGMAHAIADADLIHIKGVLGTHYRHDFCHVCSLPIAEHSNMRQHLSGSKHIKNVLASYSDQYRSHCIYCDAQWTGQSEQHKHCSSLPHAQFINALVEESQTLQLKANAAEFVLSLQECRRRAHESVVSSEAEKTSSSKCAKKSIPMQAASATKLRRALAECYNEHDDDQHSIQKQLDILRTLHKRASSAQLSEKDEKCILCVLTSLMRTNDIETICNGLIAVCQLFAEDAHTLQPSKWRMNHRLFEHIVDVLLLSVNLRQTLQQLHSLTTNNVAEKEALRDIFGYSAEKKFFEPFEWFFLFCRNGHTWEPQSSENDACHQYFMKWSELIFLDMLHGLRNVDAHHKIEFDASYRKTFWKMQTENALEFEYMNMSKIDMHDVAQMRDTFAFTEQTRHVAEPFVNLQLGTRLESRISSFSAGSFVIMFAEDLDSHTIDYEHNLLIGYVYRKKLNAQSMSVRVANRTASVPTNCRWHLHSLAASAISFENQFDALQKIAKGTVSESLKNVLLRGVQTATPDETSIRLNESALLSQLNESQLKAVQSALNHNITLIQGPPGTGKTHVAAAIVEQFLKKEDWRSPRRKILLSAFTNIAVDVLTERVSNAAGVFTLRVGWDSTLPADSDSRLTQYPIPEWQKRIDDASVVCATSIGSANELMKNTKFDLILIDESTQSTESGVLVALTKLSENGRIVLIGDHKQLPPTVCSEYATHKGFNLSLFERLLSEPDRQIAPQFLAYQYRMHPILAQFPSSFFYDSQLLSGVKSADRPIPLGFDWPRGHAFPIAFVQTENAHENYTKSSAINETEAQLVAHIVDRLVLENAQHTITVISPYMAQMKLIQTILQHQTALQQHPDNNIPPRVKVRTIDGFQGSESDIIVLSATRCNERNTVGFLKDYRRVNVMLTRPKYALIVIGDRKTLQNGDPLWRNWLQYVCDENRSCVHMRDILQ